MVVDDVATMRRLYRAYFDLSELDIQVIEAASGEEAIAILDDEEVDAVLSDHRMGAVGGIDVLAHARRCQPDALRCLVTGHADQELAALAAEEADVDVLLEKGMDVQEITRVLKQRLEEGLNRAHSSEAHD